MHLLLPPKHASINSFSPSPSFCNIQSTLGNTVGKTGACSLGVSVGFHGVRMEYKEGIGRESMHDEEEEKEEVETEERDGGGEEGTEYRLVRNDFPIDYAVVSCLGEIKLGLF